MAKKWFRAWVVISLLHPHLALAVQPNQKQKLLLEKQHKKIERRIEKNEGKKNEYFLKKRTLLNKRYFLKMRRLERKKNKMSHKQYMKIYYHLQKWFDREQRQLSYQEEKFRKKLVRHKEQFDRLQ